MDFGPKNPLRRTPFSAKIVFNNKTSILDCVVRAMTDETAELSLVNTLRVPGSFHLRIENTGEVFWCDADRRTATEIFVSLARLPTPPPAKRKPASGMSW